MRNYLFKKINRVEGLLVLFTIIWRWRVLFIFNGVKICLDVNLDKLPRSGGLKEKRPNINICSFRFW